jgi:chromosome segregation ATPase
MFRAEHPRRDRSGVNKKLAAVLSGSAVVVLALSGCGGDEGNEKAERWAVEYCGSLQKQNKSIDGANQALARITEGDKSPEEVKETDAKAFGDLSAAYKALAAAVRKAGVPPLEDGSRIQKNAISQLDTLSATYADLQKRAEDLNEKDQSEFADGLQEIAEEMKKLPRQFDGVEKALGEFRQGDLQEAIAGQKGCRKPSPAPSVSAA